MKTYFRFALLSLGLSTTVAPARAGLITGDVTIDLRTASRGPNILVSNTQSITPFTIQQGDVLDFTFAFTRDEALRFNSSSFPGNLCGGQECISLIFLNSQNAAQGLVLTNSTLQVTPYDGAFTSTTTSSTGEDCLSCMEISGVGNLTDTVASISGGRLTATVSQIPGAFTYDRVYMLGVMDDPRILVHRDFLFDLSTVSFQPQFLITGNVPVPDTLLLEEGDEYDFGFRFAADQALRIASSTLAANTICGGQECVSLVLQPGGQQLILTESTLHLDGLSGNTLTPTLSSSNEDCLNCVEVSGKGNLTDGVVQFQGGRFHGRVTGLNGSASFPNVYLGVFGDDPIAVDVPEPATLSGLFLGLLLTACRRFLSLHPKDDVRHTQAE